MEQKPLKNKELIAALQKLDPEAVVSIEIRQFNRVNGRILTIRNTPTHYGTQFWVSPNYSGATIAVILPERAIISGWPKDML